MKFRQLTEASRRDLFPEIEKLEFDPDRADVWDVSSKLLPLLVKMGYVNLVEARAKHEKLYDGPDDEKFKFTRDELADKVDDLVRALISRLEDVSHDDLLSQIKHLNDKFPEKVQD